MADDDESLDEILSGTPKPEPEATEAEPKPADPPRDDHGRFAPKEGEEQPEVVAEQPAEPAAEPPAAQGAEPMVPHSRFHAVNETAKEQKERADRLEAMLARALQGQSTAQPQSEPVKPPDFWDSPDKFLEHALSPVQQQLAEMNFRTSRAEALSEFGKDTVTAAETALKQAVESGQMDPTALKATLSRSRDPVGDVVRWHQNSPAVQQATLREQIRAELMAELKPADPSTPSPRNPIVKMPPSLTKIPAGHTAPERDESLDEVLSVPRRNRA